MLRTQISDAMKTAMREKAQQKLTVIRMMQAAIKDADINARADGNQDGIDESAVMGLLQKMIKQRQQSITMYNEAGRTELADQETAEIAIIQTFLPQAMDEQEVADAVSKAISETGASTVKDMGSVMTYLRSHYAGRMDFGAANNVIKQKLNA
jgi:uncharacterized protein